jgi:predicted transposase/invertase (TIGR01784 family)
MSLNPDAFEPIRLEFHTGKLFTGQDIRGTDRNYGDLKESWQIAFLVKGRFFPDEDFFHIFEYYDPLRRISLKGRSRIITLELSKLERVGEKAVAEMTTQEHWAFFFRYLKDKRKREKLNEVIAHEEGIAMASEVLISISRDEAERARLMSEYKYVVDTQSKVVHAERVGIQKGIQKRDREITRNLKKLGMPVEQIAQATGLTEEQINEL